MTQLRKAVLTPHRVLTFYLCNSKIILRWGALRRIAPEKYRWGGSLSPPNSPRRWRQSLDALD
jgi:hypothetical protein